MQQRDGEDPLTYKLRRDYGDTAVEIMDSAFSDLESVTGWTQLPKGNQPFRSEITVTFKPDGIVGSVLRDLNPKRVRDPEFLPDSLVNGSVRLAVTGKIQSLVKHWLALKASTAPEFPFQGIVRSVVDTKTLDLQFSLGEVADGEPGASAHVRGMKSGLLRDLGPFPASFVKPDGSLGALVCSNRRLQA